MKDPSLALSQRLQSSLNSSLNSYWITDSKQEELKFYTMHFGISMNFQTSTEKRAHEKPWSGRAQISPMEMHKIVTNSLDFLHPKAR